MVTGGPHTEKASIVFVWPHYYNILKHVKAIFLYGSALPPGI